MLTIELNFIQACCLIEGSKEIGDSAACLSCICCSLASLSLADSEASLCRICCSLACLSSILLTQQPVFHSD